MPNFAGVDVAPGTVKSVTKLGGGTKGSKSGDDCALYAWKYEGGRAEPLHAERWLSIRMPDLSARIHRLHQKYQFTTIISDPNQGGVDLYASIKQPEQVLTTPMGEERFKVTPLMTEDEEQIAGMGEPAWAFFKRAEPKIFGRGDESVQAGFLPRYDLESQLVNKLHSVFSEAIEKKRVRFGSEGREFWSKEVGGQTGNPNWMRTWLNEHEGLEGQARVWAEVWLAVMQLHHVGKAQDKDGHPKMDKRNCYQYESPYKKDLAYAMLYGYFGLWLWLERQKRVESNEPSPVVFGVTEAQPYIGGGMGDVGGVANCLGAY